MTTYNIRTTSWPLWILTLMVSLIAGGFLIAATHYTGFTDDDFEKLILEFPKITLDYTNQKENISTNNTAYKEAKLVDIKREKTLYEGKTGLFISRSCNNVYCTFYLFNSYKQIKKLFGYVWTFSFYFRCSIFYFPIF